MERVQRLDEVTDGVAVTWHGLVAAALACDLPGEAVPTLDQVYRQLTVPGQVLWTASEGDTTTGIARLRLVEGLGEFTLLVHPAYRRRGIGTRLLRTVAETTRTEGRRSLVAEASSATPGAAFLEARGFGCVLSLSLMVLSVPDADLTELTRDHHPYTLSRWLGVVPDELAETFATAKGSMGEMPTAEDGTTGWDADRVRDMAEVVEKRGDTLLTVAALHEGTVAGFTELVIEADDGTCAIQYDTAVVPEHRGNRLGLWVKAAMVDWLRDGWPAVGEIETDNAADNRHMLAVNERLGFRPLRETRQYQRLM